MSDLKSSSEPAAPGREELLTALFAQMVVQQSNLALMLLGKVPHPHTGETVRDFEGARLLIDQLEMLEAKTRGNLNQDEQQLLKHSLMSVQMAFVEAVEQPASSPAPEPAGTSRAVEGEPAPDSAPAPDDDSRKKFSKKY